MNWPVGDDVHVLVEGLPLCASPRVIRCSTTTEVEVQPTHGLCLFVCDVLQILIFNMPVNLAQGTSVMWAYVVGFAAAPLTALQVRQAAQSTSGMSGSLPFPFMRHTFG
jgi:hypothetical protein